MSCDTELCDGVCCTFITIHEPHMDQDYEYYLTLHGIEVQYTGRGAGAYLKLPVPCTAFNPDTQRCEVWDERPAICRRYPQRESPFIPPELCSLLMQRLQKAAAPIKYIEIFNKHWRTYTHDDAPPLP